MFAVTTYTVGCQVSILPQGLTVQAALEQLHRIIVAGGAIDRFQIVFVR